MFRSWHLGNSTSQPVESAAHPKPTDGRGELISGQLTCCPCRKWDSEHVRPTRSPLKAGLKHNPRTRGWEPGSAWQRPQLCRGASVEKGYIRMRDWLGHSQSRCRYRDVQRHQESSIQGLEHGWPLGSSKTCHKSRVQLRLRSSRRVGPSERTWALPHGQCDTVVGSTASVTLLGVLLSTPSLLHSTTPVAYFSSIVCFPLCCWLPSRELQGEKHGQQRPLMIWQWRQVGAPPHQIC